MHKYDLPNLFIIGAPKCGTTSMFRWLSGHPEICASKPKETWFFADRELDYLKVRPNHRENALSDYLSCFGQVNECTRVKMEGSTHYLYSEPALNFLSKISPKPRIIVQLRNPATRIWSHFNYIRQYSVTPIKVSFAEYVDELLGTSTKSTGIYTHKPWHQHLLENQLSYSNYHQHLRAWLDLFPLNQIKILIFEDLVRQKRCVVKDVANWIEVDPSYYDRYEFETVNATRSRASQKIRKHLGRYAGYFPKSVTAVSGRIVDKMLPALKSDTTPADQTALANLKEFFEGPNRRLQSEFDLDLSSWSQ